MKCQCPFELYKKTLPKAQRTQGIEFYEPTNESWSNFNLVLFGKVQELYITIFTNPRKTQFNVTTVTAHVQTPATGLDWQDFVK